ncbi:outer membrane lipoprotein carrier protein LolA [Algoriphagus sp. D3-2-R+10]|uniref:LolA family protein n=1 Tax=Algoriphagus aurantiacus TaxID=3103948 RepID=UPI002B3A7BFC|nr:outer membrane lipoprotein carrier protein LolA [Algoriphagus sp. D3-2-R+10]MEB2774960.1 outer membrane lipoprotein carrier protein LolA [Algoriphagus sp. D3-2-R+10]
MKKIPLIYTLFLALLFSFEATAQQDPKAKIVLDAMSQKIQAMNGFTANFDFTFQDASGPGDRQSGDIAVRGDQYRLKLPDQEIYNDGKTVWTFIQSDNYKEVTINDAGQMEGELTPSNIYRIYESGYSYKLIEEKQFQGKTALVVELLAEKNNAPFEQVKLMIDKSNSNLLGWEMFDGQGGVFSYTFKNLKLEANLPASYFVFDAKQYPGIEVIDLR